MFGYVKPFKPDLRICEYEAYKAVYCGLCGQLGKSFGPVARATLSYDFAFFSMLRYAVSGQEPVLKRRGCYFNPLLRMTICLPDETLSLGADMALITLYYKLIDNLRDSGVAGRALWALGYPFAAWARGKAAARHPECDSIIAAAMNKQQALEASNTQSIDAACEPTALAMQAICGMLSDDQGQKRILERIGYLIGRYVYLCDALDDLPRDLRAGGYNPFILRHKLERDADGAALQAALEAGRGAVYLTAGEAGKAYQLLDTSCFGPILENIFYQGLRARADEILRSRAPSQQPEARAPSSESAKQNHDCSECIHAAASTEEVGKNKNLYS